MTQISETAAPNGDQFTLERNDNGKLRKLTRTKANGATETLTNEYSADGRLAKRTYVAPNGATETHEPNFDDNSLKITVTFGEAVATAVIKRDAKPFATPVPATETAARAAAAIEAAKTAQRRNTVREVTERIVERVETASTDQARADATADAYGLFFGAHNPTWAAAVQRGEDNRT